MVLLHHRSHGRHGQRLTAGGSAFEVDVAVASDEAGGTGDGAAQAAAAQGERVEATVEDHGTGAYTATFTAPATSAHLSVSVRYRGEDLPGSPFAVRTDFSTVPVINGASRLLSNSMWAVLEKMLPSSEGGGGGGGEGNNSEKKKLLLLHDLTNGEDKASFRRNVGGNGSVRDCALLMTPRPRDQWRARASCAHHHARRHTRPHVQAGCHNLGLCARAVCAVVHVFPRLLLLVPTSLALAKAPTKGPWKAEHAQANASLPAGHTRGAAPCVAILCC